MSHAAKNSTVHIPFSLVDIRDLHIEMNIQSQKISAATNTTRTLIVSMSTAILGESQLSD